MWKLLELAAGLRDLDPRAVCKPTSLGSLIPHLGSRIDFNNNENANNKQYDLHISGERGRESERERLTG